MPELGSDGKNRYNFDKVYNIIYAILYYTIGMLLIALYMVLRIIFYIFTICCVIFCSGSSSN